MSANVEDKSAAKIAGMFDAIAGRYDLLNTVLSWGLDRQWRRLAIASLKLTGRERLLDVCAGTADVAIRGARSGAAHVVGVDFSGAMLVHGLEKVKHAISCRAFNSVQGDATNLPVGDATGRCGDDRVRHSQRAASRGGVPGVVPRVAIGRPTRDSRIRRAALGRPSAHLSLVLSTRSCRALAARCRSTARRTRISRVRWTRSNSATNSRAC
jgi:hypothetical protein